MIEFRVLGSLEVVGQDGHVSLGGPKPRALLALLLVHRGEVLSTDRIVDALWDEHAPRSATKLVQGYVSNLRRALGDEVLRTQLHGYALSVDRGQVDVDRFEELVAEGRSALEREDWPAAARHLKGALALWRGPALADFAYDAFAQIEAARLEEARLTALEDRIEADLGAGRHAAVVAELDVLAREHPLRERLTGQLMVALYRSGRQADALKAYQRVRHALTDELGLEPGPALKVLQTRILDQSPSLGVNAESDPALGRSSRSQLPRPPTPIAGRECDAEGLVAMTPAASPAGVAAGFRTFLISDIRGYSSFAAERGDEAAAVLTGRFIELAGDVVGRFGGDGIGAWGDEVLFAFESPRQAIRAAVALQRALLDATREDPSLPMPAGVGLDVGEAVLVPDGWRANAINVAARLCSIAKGGEILATREVAHLAQALEGIRYVPRPAARLKGIAEPVTPVRVVGEAGDAARGFAELGFTYAAAVPVHRRFRIVVADDHYLVREGVRRLLETDPEIEVVAVYADLDSLLEGVAAELPDVVLTDIRMPPTRLDEGIQAATRLRETHPDVGVVVLSQYAEPGYALALLEEGMARRGYLLKERVDDLAQLVGAIQQVAAGGSVIDPKVVESLVTRKARLNASPLNELTARERDVLREMAEGKNNAAIAHGLVLTERSVENVIHSIFVKLGIGFEPSVHKRVKAVILYLAEGG